MVYVMRLFVADDLARGVRTEETISCSACEMPRPRAGSVPYGHALLCNDCASEYEIARVMDGTLSLGQYVRDKRYGDGDRYKVADG